MSVPDSKEHQNGADRVDGLNHSKSSDPSESDPCIEEKKSKQKIFWDNTQQKLMDKSGLTRKGLYCVLGLCLVVFLLFIIVVTLGTTWPRTPHYQKFPVCRNSACLRASAQIQQYMDPSADKCNNIWQWVCGGWLSQNSLPPDHSKWNQKQELLKQEASRLRELVTTLPLPLHSGRVEWKLKHLYEACLEVDNVNADEARPLTTIISELGK